MSGEKVWYESGAIHKLLGITPAVDGVATPSGATPLANLADYGTLNAPDQEPISALDAFFGFIPGSIGETSTLAILIGAAILLFTGVASWRIMLSVFAGGLAMGYLFQAVGMTDFPAYYHVIVGGFAFGAVFMATDPVTAAQTNAGKWIYGLMIGVLAVLIRVINPAYPEGMMLSILFMNAMAPLIDYFVVERNIARRKKLIKNVK
jgi:Na+-transporting NADH:ubiquinone oxidoreductase subunit B